MVQVLQLLKRKFPSACSGSIFGNGQMLVMRTIEDTTNPLGELVSAQRIIAVGLDHFSLAVYPLGFYGVQPRAVFGQQAAYDPHSFSTLFDMAGGGCLRGPGRFRAVARKRAPEREP